MVPKQSSSSVGMVIVEVHKPIEFIFFFSFFYERYLNNQAVEQKW